MCQSAFTQEQEIAQEETAPIPKAEITAEQGMAPFDARQYTSPFREGPRGTSALAEDIRYMGTLGMMGGAFDDQFLSVKLDTFTEYEGNIYNTKDNTLWDMITHISPGVYINKGTDNNSFKGFYECDQLIYSVYTKNTRLNQAIGFRTELFQNSPFKIYVRDVLRRTQDPPTSETTEFVDRLPNIFEANIRYDMSPKTFFSLGYKQKLQNYLAHSRMEYSYLKHIINPSFNWRLSPKLTLLAEYNPEFVRYYKGAPYNSISQSVVIGAIGNMTPKSQIYIKGGYEYRMYYNTTIGRKVGNWGTAESPILECVYTWMPTVATQFELIASQRIEESVYRGLAYYIDTSAMATIRHKLLLDLAGKTSFFYIRNDYPREVNITNENQGVRRRHDTVLGFDARLDYTIKTWFNVYAGYEFKQKFSNVRNQEFKDSKIYLGAKFQI